MNTERIRKLLIPSVITAALLVASPVAILAESNEAVELSLQQAMELSMKNNNTLKSLEHQLTAADYSIKSATTGFLPKISTTVTGQHQSGNDMISKLMGSNLSNSYTVGLEIQQPIFTGFATLSALQSSKISYNLQKTTNEKTKQTIRYAVTRIYWGVVNLHKSYEVACEAVKQLEELTATQKVRMDQGMVTEHDYLLTTASLEQARLNVISVEKSLASTTRQFALYLGLPVESSIKLTDTLTHTPATLTFRCDSLLQSALQTRLDLKEINQQIALNEIGIKQARSAYYPSLVAGYSFSEARPDQLYMDQWGNSWYAYVSLKFDILDWGDRTFKVKKMRFQKLSLMAQYEQQRAMVTNEVLDAKEAFELSTKTHNVTIKLQEARGKSYKAALAKYEEGVIPLYELLDEHNNYVNAQYKVLEASADLELARVNLEMGGLGSGNSTQ